MEKINYFSQNKISVGRNCIISNEIFTGLKKISERFSLSPRRNFSLRFIIFLWDIYLE